MSGGTSALNRYIAGLRGLSRAGLVEIAAEAAPLIKEALQETARAGQTPSGEPWAPKKDGGQALAHAADNIDVQAHGQAIVVTIKAPYVFHQHGYHDVAGHAKAGAAKRKRKTTPKDVPARQIIPDKSEGLPDGVREACEQAVANVFERHMGGS